MSANQPFDYSKSLAVLIGTSDYDDEEFTDLPAAGNSLRGMRQILTTRELCAWPPSRVKELSNRPGRSRVTVKLQSWASEATGIFLLYYVGHGIPNKNGPYLTLTDSEAKHPGATSLDYADVRQALLDSPARTKIVILDCCYAGRAISRVLSGQDLFADIEGTFVLAAADGAAHVPPDDQELACTSFTGELLQLIREGIPGGPEELTLDEIYRNLRPRLKKSGLPDPNRGNTGTAGEFRFTRNAALLPEPIARFPQGSTPLAPREPELTVPLPSQRPKPAATWRRSWRTWGSAALVVVVLAGVVAFTVKRLDAPGAPCGQTAATAAPSDGSVVIGSDTDSSPEDLVLAYIYQDALQANNISVNPNITSSTRNSYYGQVCSGAITVVPEYNGALLTESVDHDSSAVTTTDVDSALDQDLPSSLEILAPASAQDKDSVTVTAATASQYHLKSIADLRRVASKMTLGASVEFDGREQGTVGLQSKYRVAFGSFDPLNYNDNSNAAVTALEQGTVQAADVYTTDPKINGLVVLKDPENLFRAENVIPLVYKPAVQAHPEIAQVLNYVSLQLTQPQLRELDLEAAQQGASHYEAIAAEWTQANIGKH